jgi:hypothetical protein
MATFQVAKVEVGEKVLVPLKNKLSEFASSYSGRDLVKSGLETWSFLDAALLAFAHHYPLVLRPDDLWHVIS